MTALLFAGGERKAGKVMIWVFYPIKVLFYYNPFSMYNQPREMQRSDEDAVRDATLSSEAQAEMDAYLNASKLRKCYEEMQLTLLMVGAICLVMSSHLYTPSRWLKMFYRKINRQWMWFKRCLIGQ